MSRRSRKHRKRFACGHRGFGQYCHCCANSEAAKQSRLTSQNHRQSLRQSWQATFANDSIDLSKLPRRVTLKARYVVNLLEQGTDYWQLAGKWLNAARSIISIPVTRRYRLLCRDDGQSLTPLTVISHEDYNPLVRTHRRLRHWMTNADYSGVRQTPHKPHSPHDPPASPYYSQATHTPFQTLDRSNTPHSHAHR
jgi:hypothetical protein